MTGFRAFSYQYVKSFPCLSSGFEIETEMTIFSLDKKMQLENVVIQYKDRQKGSFSKLNTVSDGIKVMLTIARLTKCYRPMFYYGILALLSFIVGLAFGIPGVLKATGVNFSSYILIGIGALFILIAFLLLITGSMLKVQHIKEKQSFEHTLYEINQDYKKHVNSK